MGNGTPDDTPLPDIRMRLKAITVGVCRRHLVISAALEITNFFSEIFTQPTCVEPLRLKPYQQDRGSVHRRTPITRIFALFVRMICMQVNCHSNAPKMKRLAASSSKTLPFLCK